MQDVLKKGYRQEESYMRGPIFGIKEQAGSPAAIRILAVIRQAAGLCWIKPDLSPVSKDVKSPAANILKQHISLGEAAAQMGGQ